MDAAIPFNVPVDPTALRLHVSVNFITMYVRTCVVRERDIRKR